MKPTLSELEKFEEQPDGVDIECNEYKVVVPNFKVIANLNLVL